MVQDGRAEVIFEDTTVQTPSNAVDTESTAKPKFKLVQQSGKKEHSDQFSYGTDVAFNT